VAMTLVKTIGDSFLEEQFRVAAPPGCVLAHAPSFAFQAPGGGENQLIQTSRSLHALGVEVRPFSPWVDRIDEARLLHLYGMSREGLELARVAKSQGIPVALSPICWFAPRALVALAPNRVRAAFDLAKWSARRMIRRLPDWRRELLNLSDAVLPNSHAEAHQLETLFGTDRRTIHVVSNGVDPRFANASSDFFHERFGDLPFVLYVGRIEPRKNVLNLIRATQLARLPLVIMGATVPGHEHFAERCRREGSGSVTWIDRVDHADPLLESALAAARVFALPSWFETPGLAALEAAAAGCSIVITPYGCTREYFGDRVEYARPGHVSEMARALKRAWNSHPLPEWSERIVRDFSWANVALATKEAYERIAP
jgi:glycosyltransferase involved in cell wall biosynthesis